MGVDPDLMQPAVRPVYAFDNSEVTPMGTITLPVHAAERVIPVEFLIINNPSPINAIMGRKWIHAVGGVVSTLHQVMRCQAPNGQYTIDIWGDRTQANQCYHLSSKEVHRMSQEEQKKTESLGKCSQGKQPK